MTAVARKPICLKCGGATYSELTREICEVCGYVQGEGAYLLPIAELASEKARDLEDVLDCGTPNETWREFVTHLRKRAGHARSIAHDYEKDAKDAAEQAAIHRISAEEFENLANAMENARVTFATEARHPLAEMVQLDEEMGLYESEDTLAGIETGTAETGTGSVPKG